MFKKKRCWQSCLSSYYFGKTLAEQADVVFYGDGYVREKPCYDVPSLVKRFGAEAVFIVNFWRSGKIDPPWISLDKVSVPKMVYPLVDHHVWVEEQIKWYNNSKIDFICSPLIHIFESWRKRLAGKLVFLPYSVRTDIYVPLPKKYDASFFGADSKRYYPFRWKIKKYLKTTKDINGFTHDRCSGDWFSSEKGEQIRRQSAYEYGVSRMFVFDNSIGNHPVLKFFESLSCEALPLAPVPYDVKAYNLEPDEDFVVVNGNNFIEKIKYFVKHEDERKRMAMRGRQKVLKYHGMRLRVKQLIEMLEN